MSYIVQIHQKLCVMMLSSWANCLSDTCAVLFVCVTVNCQEYCEMTYRSLHLIANKTLELVYENAPKCAILN